MDAQGRDNASQEDHIEDISPWQRIHQEFEALELEKYGGDRDEGYYGFCGRKRYREQVLEKNNAAELQRVVREVADRYIRRSN